MRLCLVLMAALVSAGSSVADWRQFRGNGSDGVAHEAAGPVEMDRIAWRADLPGRGLSGPIVVGGRVLVTCSSGHDQQRLHVLCFDARTGGRQWERQFRATGRTATNPKTCVAAPTPASDGRRVFAFFSSNDLACLDLDGHLLWYRALGADYPNATNSVGMASSLLLAGDTLLVQMETDDDSRCIGLETTTGTERWNIHRPSKANWTSAVSLPTADGSSLALLQSAAGITAIDPATGREVWTYGEGASTISSSVVAEGTVYVPSHGITALRPPSDEETSPERLWRQGRLSPHTISPLVYDGRLYTLNSAGVLASADLTNGKTAWQLRLKGPFSSSPVVAAGHLYIFNEAGLGQDVRLGPDKGETVATQDLGETLLATPAIADGALFIRSDGHLWRLGGDAMSKSE